MPKPAPPTIARRGFLPLPTSVQQAVFVTDEVPVHLTHLDKILFPGGYRKRDLLDYNYDLAGVLLPYLRDRPYTQKRYPNGIGRAPFYQKEARAPAWVPTAAIPREDRPDEVTHYVLCNNTATLLYLVNAGCIDHNVWLSRVQTADEPDFVLLDLDPGPSAGFAAVIRVAQALRRLLDAFEIAAYPKTSGASGMHICIPIAPGHTFAQSRQFALLLLRLAAARVPGLATETFSLATRPPDRVYLDARQNARAQTIPPPYSPRPLPGAPVSCPLRWSEVKAGLDPTRFTLQTVRRRLDRYGDLFAPTLPGRPHERLQPMLRRIQPAIAA